MLASSTPQAQNLHREVQALIEQAAVQQVKDRLGDQRAGGGSEWELIKILLEGD
jgi:hypothetical protein